MTQLIIEFLLEFLIPFMAEILLDLLIHIGAEIPWVNKAANNFLNGLMYFGVGLFIGFVSLWFFPKRFRPQRHLARHKSYHYTGACGFDDGCDRVDS